MPLVDPGDNRHEFDRADVQPLEMRDHGRVRERGDRPPLGFGNIGMPQSEPTHVDFVNQPAAREAGRRVRHFGERARHNRARDDRSGIDAKLREARILREATIEFHRVGIDQQLGRIEPLIARRIIFAMRAVAVAAAGKVMRQDCDPVVSLAFHGMAGFGLPVEQAKLELGGKRRAHGEVRCARRYMGAEPAGHVTTSGAVRPVKRAIPAISSAAATSSASMSGVCASSLPPTGS